MFLLLFQGTKRVQTRARTRAHAHIHTCGPALIGAPGMPTRLQMPHHHCPSAFPHKSQRQRQKETRFSCGSANTPSKGSHGQMHVQRPMNTDTRTPEGVGTHLACLTQTLAPLDTERRHRSIIQKWANCVSAHRRRGGAGTLREQSREGLCKNAHGRATMHRAHPHMLSPD